MGNIGRQLALVSRKLWCIYDIIIVQFSDLCVCECADQLLGNFCDRVHFIIICCHFCFWFDYLSAYVFGIN